MSGRPAGAGIQDPVPGISTACNRGGHAGCDILCRSGWITGFRIASVRVESSLTASLPPGTASVQEGPFSIPREIQFRMLGDFRQDERTLTVRHQNLPHEREGE